MTNTEMLKATSGHDCDHGKGNNLHFTTGSANPLNVKTKDRRYRSTLNLPVYIDTETTGLNPMGDEIIEIAILEENGTVLLDTFVKPIHVSQWPEAQAINGISPTMVKDAPALADIEGKIIDSVVGRDVYIWNANFDKQFIGFALEYANNVFCAMHEYGQFIERTQPHNKSKSGRYKLINTANDLGIKVEGDAHRAKHDVLKMIRVRKAYQAPGFNRTDLNGSVNVEPYK